LEPVQKYTEMLRGTQEVFIVPCRLIPFGTL
jgi:hypothetical protein